MRVMIFIDLNQETPISTGDTFSAQQFIAIQFSHDSLHYGWNTGN